MADLYFENTSISAVESTNVRHNKLVIETTAKGIQETLSKVHKHICNNKLANNFERAMPIYLHTNKTIL